MSGRPFTIVGAIIAVIALGTFVYLGSRATTGGVGAVGTVTQKTLVVAARDISIRVPLTIADVKIIKIDVNAVPPQAFDRVEQIKGLIPLVAIQSGQPVTGNLLVASTDQVTGAQAAFLPIPKGYVAMTIPTGEQQGVAGYIQPGDYIAIQAIMTHGSYENTRTIYTNVHVLRAGINNTTVAPVTAGKPAGPTATTGVSSSLTIIVTQCQAEYINYFVTNGSIKYTLESYKDYAPKDVAVDTTCPSVEAAGGVTINQVVQKWPGFVN
jgi:Flp pilus assembly protein CpaB